MTEIEEAPRDWTAARDKVVLPTAPVSGEDLFRGASLWEQAPLGDVPALRLTVLPGSTMKPSRSVAVCADTDWQPWTGDGVPFSLSWRQASEGRFDLHFDLPLQIKCLGLGERFCGLDLRGKSHTLITTDDTHHNEGMDGMYMSVPFLLLMDGTSVVGLFLDSPAPQRWHLDPERSGKGKVSLLSRLPWRLYVIGPTDLPGAVRAFTTLTGRAPMPPRWSLGYHQCRWSYATQETVEELADNFRGRSIPCDAIWLDIDYMDDYRVFTVSPERFPDFQTMVERLARQSLKVVTIVDPGVKRDPDWSVYREGVDRRLFCRRTSGRLFLDRVWPGISAFPDFLKAETRRWWGEKLSFLAENGVAGIWNDMNEPAFFSRRHLLPHDVDELPAPARQYFMQELDGRRVGHLEVRSLYGMLMCQATREALRSLRPDERPFVLTRSGYAGIQRYAAVWLGDNMSWFEHLRKSIPMLLNVGLSGSAFAGVDIGGFGGNADAELLVRWFEAGIFYPFCRNHSIMRSRPQEPWAYTPAVEAMVRRLISVRYRLLPYIETLFREHALTGAPLMRPLAWHCGDDPVCREIDDQFFFGRDILVAPILERGRTTRAVHFPAGRWHAFEGGRVYEGGRSVLVDLPLGGVPAFVRDGALVPLAGDMQSTADYDRVPISFVAFGDNCAGRFFESDGISFDFERGIYNEWELCYRAGTFSAVPVHRGYGPPEREYRLVAPGEERTVRLGAY